MILLLVNKHGLWSGNRYVILIVKISTTIVKAILFYSKPKDNSEVIAVNKDDKIISSIFNTSEPL